MINMIDEYVAQTHGEELRRQAERHNAGVRMLSDGRPVTVNPVGWIARMWGRMRRRANRTMGNEIPALS